MVVAASLALLTDVTNMQSNPHYILFLLRVCFLLLMQKYQLSQKYKPENMHRNLSRFIYHCYNFISLFCVGFF